MCGAEDKSGRLWKDMALQVYCENGKESYREIGHYKNGAPFLNGEECRISISHASRLLVVATLPSTPEVDLAVFSVRAAMGVDTERKDREQVLKIRDRFLSADEQAMIAADDVLASVIAWTVKEAVYKAAMTEGLDWREDIRIKEMPQPGPAVTVYDKQEFPQIVYGRATARIPEIGETEFTLYCYESEEHIVTLAYSPKCAKFTKGA